MNYAKKLAPAVAFSAVACSAAEQPAVPAAEQIALGNAPVILTEAYKSCELGSDMGDYAFKGTGKKDGKDILIFQFPLTVTKSPDGVAAARENKIAYRGVVARDTAATDPTTLFSQAPDVEYNEQTGLVRHEISRDALKAAQGRFVLDYSVRAEEVADKAHRAIDLECGSLVVDATVRGTATIVPTTHTARGGTPETTEVIIPTASRP